jgi:ATP-dependent protease Clp ATPase subunit
MRKAMAAAVVVAMVAGSLMLSDKDVVARDCSGGGLGKADYPANRAGMKGWIGLHRPDGEVIRIKTDQIVFVMSAANTGADKRALARVQLLNGFADVRESVEEVMLAVKNDDLVM